MQGHVAAEMIMLTDRRRPVAGQLKLLGYLGLALALVQPLVSLGVYPSGGGFGGAPKVEAASLATSRFYPQTGFFLRNRDGVNFLSEFDRLGGVGMLGYPVSRVFEASGFLHQALQRGILQWRPETNSAVMVNIMDELHRSGKDDWLLSKGVPPQFSSEDGSGGNFDKAREIRLSWLTDGKIRQAYLAAPDPLGFYGLPTSQPEQYGPFVAQRFQRGVLQLWLADAQGMPRPGQVVGVLAGDLALELGVVAPQALDPEYGDLDAEAGGVGLGVPAYKQERNLSCEASAAAMAASYFGVALPEEQILSELPRDPNPHRGFRGNVDGWFGGIDEYGVYAEPIAGVLSRHGLRAEVVYRLSPQALREAVKHNQLVISWITYRAQISRQVVRDIGGERVVLVPAEHAVVVTGYDARGVRVNDPATGGSDYYLNEDFARATGYFDGMAVVVSR